MLHAHPRASARSLASVTAPALAVADSTPVPRAPREGSIQHPANINRSDHCARFSLMRPHKEEPRGSSLPGFLHFVTLSESRSDWEVYFTFTAVVLAHVEAPDFPVVVQLQVPDPVFTTSTTTVPAELADLVFFLPGATHTVE